jgi:hypothetical protein
MCIKMAPGQNVRPRTEPPTSSSCTRSPPSSFYQPCSLLRCAYLARRNQVTWLTFATCSDRCRNSCGPRRILSLRRPTMSVPAMAVYQRPRSWLASLSTASSRWVFMCINSPLFKSLLQIWLENTDFATSDSTVRD